LSAQGARQKNGVADRLSAIAERAHCSAGDLRQDEPWLGNLLERGADELAGMAEELRQQDIADLIGSVEVFARRQPALVMGATVALGFALTRLIGGGPRPSDSYGDEAGQPVGGRAFAFARTPQARRPMVDPVVGRSNI
jgi:hypothetical protein